MSDIMMKSDAEIDEAVSKCTNPEQIREIMNQILARRGVISRDRRDPFSTRVVGQYEMEGPLDTNPKHEKVVRFAESTGRRPVVISANTPTRLAELENYVVSHSEEELRSLSAK